MRKIVAMVVALVMTAALLAGCGSSNNTTVTPTPSGATSSYYHPCKGSVELGEYKNLKATKVKKTITDADVEAEIKKFVDSNPNYEKDDSRDGTEVKDGDALNIDFEGKVGGVAFEGGTGTDTFLVIGSNRFIDGFESSLIGKTVGSTVDINVTFPDPYERNPDLAGAAAVFTVKINYVGKVKEIDDAYVARYLSTVATTVEELRNYVKIQLQAEADDQADEKVWNALIEAAVNNATFKEIDPADVQYYADLSLAPFKQYATYYGVTEEEIYNTMYGTAEGTYAEYCQKVNEQAELSVKQFMVLQAIVAKENLVLTDEEYRAAVEKYMTSSGTTLTFENFEAAYGKDYLNYLALNDRALELIHDSAEITEE
ncbi:MAG: trigger factor [Lachnospiraceae bacterium]|nr:trigger factor [Lachnospiraceae bacterium]